MLISEVISYLQNNKNIIIEMWLSNSKVIDIIKEYNLSAEILQKKIGFGMANSLVEILEKNAHELPKEGECFIIQELIEYILDNKLEINSIYMLCMKFRASLIYLIQLTFKNSDNIWDMISHINDILDINMQKMLLTYVNTINVLLKQYRTITDEMNIISKTDENGIITFVNDKFCKISGYSREELIGKSHNIVRHYDIPKETFKELWETILSGNKWEGVMKNRKKNGEPYYVEAIVLPLLNEVHKINGFISVRHDITELVKKEKKLQNAYKIAEEYRKAADLSNIVSKSDLQGNITYVNDEFCKISSYTREELIGKPHNIVRSKNVPKEIFAEMWRTIKSKQIWKGQLENTAKDGKNYIVYATIVPILNENNDIIEYIGIRKDITEILNEHSKSLLTIEQINKEKEHLQKLSLVDNLTGAWNRNKFYQKMKIIVDENTVNVVSIFLFDVDNFKNINDTHGHNVGDIILKELSELCSRNIRSNDFFIRWGGEEFMFLLQNTDLEKAYIFAEKIRKLVENNKFNNVNANENVNVNNSNLNNSNLNITISGGVSSFYVKEDDNLNDFIERADKKLYQAKKEGRNKIVI